MKNYSVKRYQDTDYEKWNAFIGQAKNATFLFHRDFMEYHKDRFQDYSLLVYDGQKLVAVLPANRVEAVVYSHQGLTYGGLVFTSALFLSEVMAIVGRLLFFLKEENVTTLHLKLLPALYPILPSEEMEYLMFLLEAKLVRRDSIAVLDLENRLPLSRVRQRGIKKGIDNNIVIKEEVSFESFWNQILIPNLKSRYNVSPVHSLDEITYLKSKFPNEIKQFNAYYKDKIVAGVTVFEKGRVVHPQYISGDKKINNSLGSLDYLYSYLIENVYPEKKYFDFGISNENQGKKLNEQLHYWKESFGARTFVQNFYEVETANYYLLDQVLI